MDFQEYEIAAARTLSSEEEQEKVLTAQQTTLLLGAMGMAGEAGEFLDHVKKILFHHQELTPERWEKMFAELGDILWYHFVTCRALKTSMSAVADGNIEKLEKRHPNGLDFSYHQKQLPEGSLRYTITEASDIAIKGKLYRNEPLGSWVFEYPQADGDTLTMLISDMQLPVSVLYFDDEARARLAVRNRLLAETI